MPAPAYDIAEWRSRIPLLAHAIPMNNCSQAPQSDATRAAADAYLESWARDGMDWDAWVTEVERARESFARLINADVDEVAVTSSVSHAASALASALSFDGERNRVLASAAEFPTVGHVWLAQRPRGAEVSWAPLSADGTIDVAEYARVDERTRVVSACHAYFANGFKQDIGAIARIARSTVLSSSSTRTRRSARSPSTSKRSASTRSRAVRSSTSWPARASHSFMSGAIWPSSFVRRSRDGSGA